LLGGGVEAAVEERLKTPLKHGKSLVRSRGAWGVFPRKHRGAG
jgi:hypothetical protein